MGNYGIKVSKAGEDVLTTADKNLIYSSAFNTLKVFASGMLHLTTDGAGNGTVSVAHNLGFAPAFKSYIEFDDEFFPDPGTYQPDWTNFMKLHVYTDDTNLYFQAVGATIDYTYNLAYYIFADLAQIFAGASISLDSDYGIKISQPGVDVKSAELYELSFLSRFPALKFEDALVGTLTLSLPAINCTDTPNTQSVSGSINHGLGYSPFYLCAFKTNNSTIYPVSANDRQTLPWSVHSGITGVAAWSLHSTCGDVGVAFQFSRRASCVSGFFPPCDIECFNWGAETVTVYYYIFRENMMLL